jgi:hypothetical protein
MMIVVGNRNCTVTCARRRQRPHRSKVSVQESRAVILVLIIALDPGIESAIVDLERFDLNDPIAGRDWRPLWGIDLDEIEIWHSSRDRLRVRLTSPTGGATPWVHAGEHFDQPADANNPNITIEAERFTRLNGDALTYKNIDADSECCP